MKKVCNEEQRGKGRNHKRFSQNLGQLLPFLEEQNFRSIIKQVQEKGVAGMIEGSAALGKGGRKKKQTADVLAPEPVVVVVPPEKREIVRYICFCVFNISRCASN